jgi:murein L,D-transpeptidase YcbB/YkuD
VLRGCCRQPKAATACPAAPNLISKIPVLIVCGTATVNEENQIRFFDDIYGYDAER